MSDMLDDPGIAILLTVQLALSLAAMIAWLLVVRDSGGVWVKRAALVTAAWFAGWAAAIAYLFDVGLVP